ncbi:hypothetical protein T05_15700 [Trichinella murrelli]|uniref:Uncharacterized protein n=1 Tax=Trichinella murrelli TaxID=144512 RepID=A0A0V0UH49_9BILA|nr:hypothetical protein T05_15700 [Trichinella murrelli]
MLRFKVNDKIKFQTSELLTDFQIEMQIVVIVKNNQKEQKNFCCGHINFHEIQSVSSLCLLISNESNSDEVHCKFLDEIMKLSKILMWEHKQQQQQKIDFLIFDYSFWKNVVSLRYQERLNLKKCANDDDDDNKSNEINNNVTKCKYETFSFNSDAAAAAAAAVDADAAIAAAAAVAQLYQNQSFTHAALSSLANKQAGDSDTDLYYLKRKPKNLIFFFEI